MGQPQIPVPNLDTARKPEKLYEFLRLFSDAVRKLDLTQQGSPVMFELTSDMITTIRDMLQANGSDPLNVNGLLGVLAQPQVAAVVIASSQPNAANYMPGTLLIVTGTPDVFYYNKTGTPNTWQAISTAPTNMMTLDTPQTVTSLAVKTIQASWIFQVNQSLINALDAALVLSVEDTNASGNSAVSVIRAKASTAISQLSAFGAGYSGTAFGIALANWSSYNNGNAGNGILLGTLNTTPIVFGTNNVERARFDSAGLMTFITPSKCILVKPSSAPAANTLMLEVQSNAAASLFSVDSEGDVICQSIDTNVFSLADGDISVTINDATNKLLINNTASSSFILLEVQQSGSQKFAVTGDGDGSFARDLDVGGILDVTGVSIFGGQVTINDDLNVNGSVEADATSGFIMGTRFWRSGTGSPEGAITGPVGCLWTRTDGGASTTLYVKESGTGNTGWIAK